MLVNHKAYLFNSVEGNPFIILFVHTETEEKKLQYKIFASEASEVSLEFTPAHSERRVMGWLTDQGNVFVKRLPLTKGDAFCSAWKIQVIHWLYVARYTT